MQQTVAKLLRFILIRGKMEQKYKTILTHHGERVIVEALANKIPVPLEMAIGDGNGSSITPSASQTTLVRSLSCRKLQIC